MSAYFDDEQVLEISGKSSTYSITGEKEQNRYFCPECGTTLFWTIAGMPGQTGIAAGCFIDEPLPDPALTVSNDGKFDWVALPQDWKTSV